MLPARPDPIQAQNTEFLNQKFREGKNTPESIMAPVSEPQEKDSINSEISDESGKLFCDECMKCFSSISKYNRHMREVHTSQNKRFKCQVCSKTFKRKEHLNRHIKAKHLGDKLQCPLCVARFVEPYKLKNHLRDKHLVYKCEKCGVIVKTNILGKHECNDEYIQDKPGFTCRICNKQYKRKGYLIKHLEAVHKNCADANERTLAKNELLKNQDAEKQIETHLDNESEDTLDNTDDLIKNDLVVKNKLLKSSLTKSDSSLKTRDFYELEINLEYDVITKEGQALGTPSKIVKKDLFSGMIKLPKAFAKNFINNQMFGEIKFDNKKLTPTGKLPKKSVGK